MRGQDPIPTPPPILILTPPPFPIMLGEAIAGSSGIFLDKQTSLSGGAGWGEGKAGGHVHHIVACGAAKRREGARLQK